MPTATENNKPESQPTTETTVTATERSEPASTITDLDKKEALGVFADQHLTEDEEVEVPKAEVYSAYESWAEKHAVEKVTKSWFTRYLTEYITFDTDRRREDGEVVRYFVGFTLDRVEESE